jgi:glyoxylase-like metal-dependent hydrolase (beta-lactamase superfamily II)
MQQSQPFWLSTLPLLLCCLAVVARAQGDANGSVQRNRGAQDSAVGHRGKAAATLRVQRISASCHAVVRSGGRSNAGFVVGRDRVLVIDCLDSPVRARELLQAIRSVTDRPVRTIVHTHGHYDHTVGNQAMPDGVEIIASRAAADWLARRLKKDRLLLGPAGGGIHASLGIRGVRNPTRSITVSTELDLGGLTVRLLVAGDCHSAGDLVVYVPSEKVLFAGDLAWSGCHPNIAAGSTFRWIAALARIERLAIGKVVPGHGAPGSKDLLAGQRHYLMDLRRLVKHLARKNVDPKVIVQKLEIPESYREFAHAAWWPKNVGFVHRELMRNR